MDSAWERLRQRLCAVEGVAGVFIYAHGYGPINRLLRAGVIAGSEPVMFAKQLLREAATVDGSAASNLTPEMAPRGSLVAGKEAPVRPASRLWLLRPGPLPCLGDGVDLLFCNRLTYARGLGGFVLARDPSLAARLAEVWPEEGEWGLCGEALESTAACLLDEWFAPGEHWRDAAIVKDGEWRTTASDATSWSKTVKHLELPWCWLLEEMGRFVSDGVTPLAQVGSHAGGAVLDPPGDLGAWL